MNIVISAVLALIVTAGTYFGLNFSEQNFGVSIFQVQQGGTGWGNFEADTLLTGNGTNKLATTSVGSGLQLVGGILSTTGGDGAGTVGTSSQETAGQVAVWSTTNGYPALLYSQATSSLTINAPLTSAGTPGYVLGGSGWTLDIDDIGPTDLASSDFGDWSCNGTTCTLDTSYTPTSRTLTVAGTANQLTSSAGAQDLSANRTWTLSLPSHVIFPGNFFANNSTTTNATTTALDVLDRLTFGGVSGTTWAAFCESITGSAGLCDGNDASGAGGSAYEIATTSDIAVSQVAYITKTAGLTTLGSVATGTVSSANSALTVTGNRYVLGGGLSLTVATTSNNMFTGTAGQVLAFTGSGWTGVATTTYSSGLTYLNGNVTADLGTSIAVGELASADFGSFTCNGVTCTIDNGAVSNTMLANSTISGIALGSNLADLTNDATLSGSSYNGSAAISDWGINLTNPNTWTGLQQFTRASSTIHSSYLSYFGGTATTTIDLAGNVALPAAGTLTVPALTSALILTNGSGLFGEYTGIDCTNQFVRDVSAAGAGTCATVVAADVDLADLTATNSSLTFSGTYDGQTARTIGLNVGNANVWTALQTFTNASSTQLTIGNPGGGSNVGIYFTQDGDGALTIQGIGNNANEDLVFNFDDTVNTVSVTSNTSVSNLDINGLSLTATSILADSNDSGALGSAAVSWSDLFLADGGVLNWGNGGVTLTHTAASDSMTWALDAANGLASTLFTWALDGANELVLSASALYPSTDDGLALGIANTNEWADLFLNTGGILNWANGDVTLTHSAGALALSASDLLDLGGSILEIPNGTGPTADDVGELAHDTTDNMLILDDFVVAKATQRMWGVTVASTSPYMTGGTNLAVPDQADGYTMTSITCRTVSGTSVAIIITDGTNATESITCDSDGASDDGSITNAGVTAGEDMYIDFGTVTGAVDTVSISVFGQWTRE